MSRAKSNGSGQQVRVTELAGELGVSEVTVITLLDREKATVHEDWAGRPVVGAEIAARIVSSYQLEVESNESRHAAYEQYLRRRESERQAAGQEAYTEGSREALTAELRSLGQGYAGFVLPMGRPISSPSSRMAGREAMHEALVEFDRKHPVVSFENFEQ